MQDIYKQIEKSINDEIKSIEKSFTKDFNEWINKFAKKSDLDIELLDVDQKNTKRFAEVFYENKLIAYVTLTNNRLRFYELI